MVPGGALDRIRTHVKEAGKIFIYLAGVLFFGALIAPPLYWGAHALMDAGILLVLRKFAFQKYFNRGVLIAAVALLWPLIHWLGIRGWRPPSFRRDPQWRGHLWKGVLIGSAAMGVLGTGYLVGGVYRWDGELNWRAAGAVLGAAVAVSLLEEGLFRGAIHGLLERGMGTRAALWVTSSLFAVVHFLKPDPSVQVEVVRWSSGFKLIPHSFHQFAEPLLFAGGFCTLLVLGLVLGLAALRTGSLWMSIGLHGGLVLVKGLFSKGTVRCGGSLPWVGPELQIGLFPVLILALAGLGVLLATRKTAPQDEGGKA